MNPRHSVSCLGIDEHRFDLSQHGLLDFGPLPVPRWAVRAPLVAMVCAGVDRTHGAQLLLSRLTPEAYLLETHFLKVGK
jgi:hypothetical protein